MLHLALALVGLCLLSVPNLRAATHLNPFAISKSEDPSQIWDHAELDVADGSSIHFADFRGKVLLIDFFFTSCSGICPAQTSRLHQLIKTLDAPTRTNVAFLSISIDPENDSNAKLKEYKKRFTIADDLPWTFARPKMKDLAKIAEYMGAVRRENPLDHRGRVYLFDSKGHYLLSYQTEPTMDSVRIATDIKASIRVGLSQKVNQ